MVAPDTIRTVIGIIGEQWDCPRAFPLPSADVPQDLEDAVGGAVLGDPVRRDAAQLPGVGAVRPAGRASAQHAGGHHQRHRHGDRARVHRALPALLGGRDAAQGAAPPRRRGGLRRCRGRARRHPRAHPRAPVHDRRRARRPLRHRHVRRAALSHENGDPDKERGVHAALPVPGIPHQRRLLDYLRTHQIRPLYHHPQRPGRAVRGGAGGALRHLLQVDAGDHRGAQAQVQPRRHDRGRLTAASRLPPPPPLLIQDQAKASIYLYC